MAESGFPDAQLTHVICQELENSEIMIEGTKNVFNV
jgi:hypothetical protein